jgi:ribonuclease BN (tRNA processing enzyme)
MFRTLSPELRPTRRTVLAGAAVLGGMAFLPAYATAAGATVPNARLVLLGTQGGPNANLTRSETASALQVNGALFLIDCGYGTRRGMMQAGIDIYALDAIFLTHLHDDHTADLSAILTHLATQTRRRALTVYGPPGTNAMVEAVRSVLAPNAAIRIADEQRDPAMLSFIKSVEVAPGAPFLEYAGVTVTCAENSHYPRAAADPDRPLSFGYRFDWGRSVVFSGDTSYSPRLVELAKGADVFVCEVLEPVAMRQAFDAMVAGGAFAGVEEGVWEHILGTHATPAQVGRMAAEAGVGKVVLNHFAPGALNELPDSTYQQGVGQNYSGPVVVGKDGMAVEI